MVRALLWLLPALALLALMVALIAPGAGWQAAALGSIAIVPGVLVVGFALAAGRRRHQTED